MGHTPLMTWGEVASTPLRLDLEDDLDLPLPNAEDLDGPRQVHCCGAADLPWGQGFWEWG